MISKFYWLLKTYSFSGLLYRIYFELSKKISILERRFPAKSPDKIISRSFDEQELSLNNHGCFIDFYRLDHEYLKNHLDIESINLNLKGIYRVFSSEDLYYGNPIEWDKHPVSKKKFGANLHWTKIENTPASVGDIKYYWEISRFSFIAQHILAYHCTDDDVYFKHFWECFDSWVENNPPELGLNWRCGQEIGIRVLFWILAYFGFFKEKKFTLERKTKLINHIIYSGRHIKKNINFAYRTVRNNHVISEASILYLVSSLFPFIKESKKWKKTATKILEKEALRQFFPDGTYIQYSFNYHRMVLEFYLLVLLVARKNGDEFSDKVKDRLLKGVKQLHNMQSKLNGHLPNFGSNDGTQLLPFALKSDYLDYRPQLQTIYFMLTGKRLYKNGEWDIYPSILLGETYRKIKDDVPLKKKSQTYEKGGLHILRGINSHAFLHCGNYISRPSQSDMFHFDFWYKGQNILVDSGSYLYNSPDKLEEYFTSPAAHNTLILDNEYQMQQGPRFLWYKWTKVSIKQNIKNEKYDLIEAEHYGYNNKTHRRGVFRVDDTWLVVDDIWGDRSYSFMTLRWLLAPECTIQKEDNMININRDEQTSVNLHVFYEQPTKIEVRKADDSKPDGWISFYYGSRVPANFIDIKPKGKLPLRLITLIQDAHGKYQKTNNEIQIDKTIIHLNNVESENIFTIFQDK